MAQAHFARVVINNTTTNKLENAVLLHQFGDEYCETLQWDVPLGGSRQSSSKVVRYATGFGAATDYDWWSLSWETEVAGQRYLHSTSPSLFTVISDYFLMQGKGVLDAGGTAGQHVGTVLAQTTASAAVSGGTSAATNVVNVLLGGVMRKVSKVAFVNFNLSAQDAYVPGAQGPEVCFVVKPDGKVAIATPRTSKDCEYSSLAVPLPIAEM